MLDKEVQLHGCKPNRAVRRLITQRNSLNEEKRIFDRKLRELTHENDRLKYLSANQTVSFKLIHLLSAVMFFFN